MQCNRLFCHFGPFFAPLPEKPKLKKKWKKPSGDVIILYMYTINEKHMMSGS